MQGGLKPIRRVVTGNDERGRSGVVWDGPAPAAHEASMGAGRGHIDFWVWNESPAPLTGTADAGNLPYNFPGPPMGGHWRVVQGAGRAPDYDAATDPHLVRNHEIREHPLGRRWDRGGANAYSGGMHKTETVDYAILIDGERTLVLDDCELAWRPGDVVIDVGAWHQWSSRNREGGRVAFDMIAANFVDGPIGLAQGKDRIMRADPGRRLPQGVKPARRIVCLDREPGKSTLASDGPSPDVRVDPARPGFASQRMWVTDSTPAKIVLEGEIVLVLDTQEVRLKAGDFVVQRGTNHAWSNRCANSAIVAIAAHDGA